MVLEYRRRTIGKQEMNIPILELSDFEFFRRQPDRELEQDSFRLIRDMSLRLSPNRVLQRPDCV
jgi:hypothetical protein